MDSDSLSVYKIRSAIGPKIPRTVPPPNYTQLPNEILEAWLPILAGPEFKIVA